MGYSRRWRCPLYWIDRCRRLRRNPWSKSLRFHRWELIVFSDIWPTTLSSFDTFLLLLILDSVLRENWFAHSSDRYPRTTLRTKWEPWINSAEGHIPILLKYFDMDGSVITRSFITSIWNYVTVTSRNTFKAIRHLHVYWVWKMPSSMGKDRFSSAPSCGRSWEE